MNMPEFRPSPLMHALVHARGVRLEFGLHAMFAYVDAIPEGLTNMQLCDTLGRGRDIAYRARWFFEEQNYIQPADGSSPRRNVRYVASQNLIAESRRFNGVFAGLVEDHIPGKTRQALRESFLGAIIAAHSLEMPLDDAAAVIGAASQQSGQHPESIRYRGILAIATLLGVHQKVMADARDYYW